MDKYRENGQKRWKSGQTEDDSAVLRHYNGPSLTANNRPHTELLYRARDISEPPEGHGELSWSVKAVREVFIPGKSAPCHSREPTVVCGRVLPLRSAAILEPVLSPEYGSPTGTKCTQTFSPGIDLQNDPAAVVLVIDSCTFAIYSHIFDFCLTNWTQTGT